MTPTMLTNDVTGKAITLSPSGLNDAFETPHLFWLHKKKNLAWPRGAFPTLPSGVDAVLKERYDDARLAHALPPELVGHGLTGLLEPDQLVVNKFRAGGKSMPKTVVTETVNSVLYGLTFQGMVDDIVREADGALTVYDNKTKGWAPKEEPEATLRYYGRQANGYALLFQAQGYKASGKAHFAYHYPVEADTNELGALAIQFKTQVVTVPCLAMTAERDLKAVIRLLVGPCPGIGMEHEKDAFLRDYAEAMGNNRPAREATAA